MLKTVLHRNELEHLTFVLEQVGTGNSESFRNVSIVIVITVAAVGWYLALLMIRNNSELCDVFVKRSQSNFIAK